MKANNDSDTTHEVLPTSIKLPSGLRERLSERMKSEGLRSLSEVIVQACNDMLSRKPLDPDARKRQLLERASEYSEAKSAAIDMRRDVLQALTSRLGYTQDEVVVDPVVKTESGRTFRGDFALPSGTIVLVRGTVNAMERTLGEAVVIRSASGADVLIVVPYIIDAVVREVAVLIGDLDGIKLVTMEQLVAAKSPAAKGK